MKARGRCFLIGLVLLTGSGCAGPGPRFLPRQAPQEEITLLPTPTDFPSTPTETLLPTIELPTPEATLPLAEAWSGPPTYPAESIPGFDFLVHFDPASWALSQDEMGLPALVHRQLPYCQITPTSGHGAPRGWSSESERRTIGDRLFEVYTISQGVQVRYLNFFGGDGTVMTGFQVSFQDEMEACVEASQAVLASLSSTPAPLSTPTLEPTATETPWPTPTGTETPAP